MDAASRGAGSAAAWSWLQQQLPLPAAPASPLLVIATAVVGALVAAAMLWRVVLPFLRARHPSTGYIPGNEAAHLLCTGANVPVIHAFLVIEGTLTAAHMMEVLREAGIPTKRFKRLGQCVSASPARLQPFDPATDWPAYWWRDDSFDLAHHVRHLPDGMDHAALTAYLASVVNTPPPFDRSPWEILLSTGFDGKDATALVLRLHHVLGDGLSILGVLEAISRPRHAHDANSTSLANALRVGVKRDPPHPPTAGKAAAAAAAQAKRQQGALTRVQRALGRYLALLRLGLRMCVELPVGVRQQYYLPPPEVNMFKPRPLTGRKDVGYHLTALDVARVRAVKDALGVKVNDVLLACAAGALRRMHVHVHDKQEQQQQGSKAASSDSALDSIPMEESEDGAGEPPKEPALPPPPPETIRFFAPMSVRTNLSEINEIDNQLSVLSIPLPTGPACRLHRLASIHGYMAKLKASTVPLGMAWLTRCSGHMPRAVLEFQSDYFCDKATGVLTNVPGPVHQRTLHGKPIQEIMFFVPAISSIGITLSSFSYMGKFRVGMVVDKALPCEAGPFLQCFVEEFEAYEAHVLATKVKTE